MNGFRLLCSLKKDGPVISPGCFDALSAKLIENMGFECLSISGAAFSAETFGLPDLGFYGLEDLVKLVDAINYVVDIPIIVDCESGFGNTLNVIHTVQKMGRAGASCICIQDKAKDDNSFDDNGFIEKIAAAKDSASIYDMLVMARIDETDLEKAFTKAEQCIKYGADVLFFSSATELDDFEKIKSMNLSVPLKYNNAIKNNDMQYSPDFLYGYGFSLVSYSASLQKAAIKAMMGILCELRSTGMTIGWKDKKISQKERDEIVGKGKWLSYQERYRSGSKWE